MGTGRVVRALLGLATVSCTGIIEGPAETFEGNPAAPGGTAEPGQEQQTQQQPQTQQDPFLQCAVCHGPEGEGTALGYELQHPVREYARWVVRNGRSGPDFPNSVMLAFSVATLSDTDLDGIFDYLAGLPQPTTGQGLYLDYCGNCHGADARGGAVGKDISDKGFNDALESVRKGAGADFSMRSRYMPAFDAATLSDNEVRAITDYMATL